MLMKGKDPNPGSQIKLHLSHSEALVLFEFLSRFSGQKTLQIQDESEQRVLWNLQAELERVLAEPFSKDYEAHLKTAREEVKGA